MRIWRWMAGSTMAVAIFFVPGLSLVDIPPPADQGSFVIPESASPRGGWTTPAVELTTTAIGISWQPGTEPGEVSVRASQDGAE